MLEAIDKKERSFQSASGQFRVETIKARPKLIRNAKVKDVFTPQKNTRSRNQHKRRMLLQSEGSYGGTTCGNRTQDQIIQQNMKPTHASFLRKSFEAQESLGKA